MKLTTGLEIMGAALALAAPAVSHATISVTSAAFTYTQDFDSLATTGTDNPWANDVTLTGWSLFKQPLPGTAITTYDANNGSSATGKFYSYGSTSDRALGGLGSNSAYFGTPVPGAGDPAGAIAVGFTNNSGQTIGSVTVSFVGEQWRNGGNASAQPMVLQVGVGATFVSIPNSGWTTLGGNFNWSSPIHVAGATALDGNAAANRVTGVGGTVTALWQPGQTVWIRWIERNDVGNDHGLAIDNFTLTTTPIPEPSSVALFAAGAAFLGAFQIRRRRRDR